MSLPQIFFSSYFGNAIATNQLPPFFFPSILAMPFHKSIATFFFPFISLVPLPQINHNFFLKKNSSPRFRQLGCHIFFSSHFQQLGCHNSYFLSPSFPKISATWLPQLVSLSGTPPSMHFGHSMTKTRILVISLPKFNFFSLPITSFIFLLSHTFSYNVGNGLFSHFSK